MKCQCSLQMHCTWNILWHLFLFQKRHRKSGNIWQEVVVDTSKGNEKSLHFLWREIFVFVAKCKAERGQWEWFLPARTVNYWEFCCAQQYRSHHLTNVVEYSFLSKKLQTKNISQGKDGTNLNICWSHFCPRTKSFMSGMLHLKGNDINTRTWDERKFCFPESKCDNVSLLKENQTG